MLQSTLPDTFGLVKRMLQEGLFLDPPLAGIEAEQFTGDAFALLETATEDLVNRYVDRADMAREFPHVPITDRLIYSSIYEFTASTAVLTAHTLYGHLNVNRDIARQSIEAVENFIQRHGYLTFVLTFGMIVIYHGLQAIHYYGEVKTKDFVSGSLHRPWVTYTLEDDAWYFEARGLILSLERDGEQYLTLTEDGLFLLQSLSRDLELSGYQKKRMQLLAISHFNGLEDMDALQEEAWPNALEERKRFIDVCDIHPGQTVLEIAIATGLLTVDGGLADRIGSTGSLTAIDISSVMISRAERKIQRAGLTNITLQQADVHRLPFADGTFERTVGFAFLHFTNRETALREIKRVTRPGGLVGIATPVTFSLDVPFFREWFAPLFTMAQRNLRERPKSYIPQPGEVEAAFEHVGFKDVMSVPCSSPWVFADPERVVRYVIEGLSMFSEELLELPWKARQEVIRELVDRGRVVCENTTLEERVIFLPGEFVTGRV